MGQKVQNILIGVSIVLRELLLHRRFEGYAILRNLWKIVHELGKNKQFIDRRITYAVEWGRGIDIFCILVL